MCPWKPGKRGIWRDGGARWRDWCLHTFQYYRNQGIMGAKLRKKLRRGVKDSERCNWKISVEMENSSFELRGHSQRLSTSALNDEISNYSVREATFSMVLHRCSFCVSRFATLSRFSDSQEIKQNGEARTWRPLPLKERVWNSRRALSQKGVRMESSKRQTEIRKFALK